MIEYITALAATPLAKVTLGQLFLTIAGTGIVLCATIVVILIIEELRS